MPSFLPPLLQAIFVANPPIRRMPPPDPLRITKRRKQMTGVAGCLQHFEVGVDPRPNPPLGSRQRAAPGARRDEGREEGATGGRWASGDPGATA